MKIKSIKLIKQYKSFHDFTWHRYFNTETFHDNVNILFGENGCGKSSICNILKSVSQNKVFQKYEPKETRVKIQNGVIRRHDEQATGIPYHHLLSGQGQGPRMELEEIWKRFAF